MHLISRSEAVVPASHVHGMGIFDGRTHFSAVTVARRIRSGFDIATFMPGDEIPRKYQLQQLPRGSKITVYEGRRVPPSNLSEAMALPQEELERGFPSITIEVR